MAVMPGAARALAADAARAARSLRAAPALVLSAVLTLALGIGASTTIFSIVNGLLLRPLPVAAPEQLAAVSSDLAVERGFKAGAGWNFAMFEALERRSGVFDGVLAWQPVRFSIGRGGDTAVVDGIYASDGFFSTLGVRSVRGSLFTNDNASNGVATAGHQQPAMEDTVRRHAGHRGRAPHRERWPDLRRRCAPAELSRA
jgi:hypothetical protein